MFSKKEKIKNNNGVTSGILIFDKDKNIIMTSSGISGIIGVEQKKINIDVLLKFFKEQKEDLEAGIEGVILRGESKKISDVVLNNLIFEICVSPIFDDQKKNIGGVIIIHDATYLKEAENIKREFVSVASHQMRTPLTGVKLFTDMLLRGDVGPINEAQKKYLENVYQGVKAIVGLTDNLMNLFKLEYGSVGADAKVLSATTVAQNVLRELKGYAKKRNIKIDFYAPQKDCLVFADKLLIQQAFFNLVLNAIQYSPTEIGNVKINIKRSGDKCVFEIRDNGIGIAKKDQKKIFDKFFRAENAIKAETEGSGLGLYVSRMIVEKFNGEIWLESRVGGGALFCISLPIIKKKFNS